MLVQADAEGAVPCRQCRERRLGEVRVRHKGSLDDGPSRRKIMRLLLRYFWPLDEALFRACSQAR
jgi:hypothetical protein